MAPENRNAAANLSRVLAMAPRMGFFRLVTLLERLAPSEAGVGLEGPPRAERIRFRHDPALGFSSGDVQSATLRADGQLDVTTTFLGLIGGSSPLPPYFAEEVLHEDEEDASQGDFLDIFHHRLISLFYRAVVRYSPAATHSSEEEDVWLMRMLALAAVQFGSYRAFPSLPPGRLLRLVPLLVRRGRGARTLRLALEVMLEGYLGDARVTVEELSGSWSPIDRERWVALGRSNTHLGGLMLGQKTPDPGGRFTIRIGPIDAAHRRHFERTGKGLALLRETVSLVVRAPLAYDLELELEADAVRPMRLGREGELGRDARLVGRRRAERMRLRDADAINGGAS